MVREGRERDEEGKEDLGGWVLRGIGTSRGVERERKGRGRDRAEKRSGVCREERKTGHKWQGSDF